MTPEEWTQKALDFGSIWQHPRAVAAIDGKHIEIRVCSFCFNYAPTIGSCFSLKAPPNSGAAFYNYKQYYSIILLAIVDAKYKVSLHFFYKDEALS